MYTQQYGYYPCCYFDDGTGMHAVAGAVGR